MSDYAARALERRGMSAGWWGILTVIASEGMLLGSFMASYWYLRFHTAAWPPDGIPKPRVIVPVVLACVLAATSLPMQLAAFAARAGRLTATRLLLLWALVVQSGYLAYEVHDYVGQLHADPVQHDTYTSIYFTLLGADHGHVALGLLFDVWLLGKLARGLTMYRLNALQAIVYYWHAINLLTLVITGVLLSATF